MLTTEKQAKGKWCPHVRVHVGDEAPAVNRTGNTYNCIGTGCQQWRWTDMCQHPGDTDALEAKRWHRPWSEYAAERDNAFERIGYCGIAGKPEA